MQQRTAEREEGIPPPVGASLHVVEPRPENGQTEQHHRSLEAGPAHQRRQQQRRRSRQCEGDPRALVADGHVRQPHAERQRPVMGVEPGWRLEVQRPGKEERGHEEVERLTDRWDPRAGII
jgi:hypothetical protein